jgi:hypothetical protein
VSPRGSYEHTKHNTSGGRTLPATNDKAGPLSETGLARCEKSGTAPDAQRDAVNRQHHNLTRSKLVFRAYLDAKLYDDADEAAELFELWLRLLGRAGHE